LYAEAIQTQHVLARLPECFQNMTINEHYIMCSGDCVAGHLFAPSLFTSFIQIVSSLVRSFSDPVPNSSVYSIVHLLLTIVVN